MVFVVKVQGLSLLLPEHTIRMFESHARKTNPAGEVPPEALCRQMKLSVGL